MTNAKCNISSLNNYLNLIGMILLPAILVITLVYFIYVIYNKKEKIKEDFSTVSVYNSPNNTGCEYSNSIYASNIAPLRDCTLYFTELKKECDEEYANDPSNTCKYVLDGWKEMDSLNDVKYTNKIYKSDYTNNLTPNDDLTANLCFKQFLNNNTKQNYEYNYNDTVKHNCIGTRDNIFSLNNNKYTTLQFKNSDDNTPYTKHQNVINAICSKKMETISDIKDIKFIKIKLDSDNKIQGGALYTGKFNKDQTDFSISEYSLNEFTVNSTFAFAYHEYKNNNHFFKISRNTSFPNIPITIYKFNYNYLCPNGQVIDFSKQDNEIIVSKLITVTSAQSVVKTAGEIFKTQSTNGSYNIVNIPSELNAAFFNMYKGNTDQLNNMIDGITTKINNRKNAITLENQATIDHLTTIFNDKNSQYNEILTNYTKKKNSFDDQRYTETNLNIMTTDLNISKGVLIEFKSFDYDYNEQEYVRKISNWIKGLSFRKYNGYFWDNFNHFKYNTPIDSQTGGVTNLENLNTINSRQRIDDSDSVYSYHIFGYFKPKYSGYHRFHVASDDASYLLINDNIVVNNGGLHGRHGVNGIIYLEINKYYKLDIYFGENYGGDNLTIYFERTIYSESWITNLDSYVFTRVDNPITSVDETKGQVSILNRNYYYIMEDPSVVYDFNVYDSGAIYNIFMIGGGGGGSYYGGGFAGKYLHLKDITLEKGAYKIIIGDGGVYNNKGGKTYISKNDKEIYSCEGGEIGVNYHYGGKGISNYNNNTINNYYNGGDALFINTGINNNLLEGRGVFGGGGGGYNGRGGSANNIKVGGDDGKNGVKGTGSGGGKNGGSGGSGIVIIVVNTNPFVTNNNINDHQELFDNNIITDANLWNISSLNDINKRRITTNLINTINSQKMFTYNIYAYIFLQKGFYKFISYISDNNNGISQLPIISELYIINNYNNFFISGCYSSKTKPSDVYNNYLYTTKEYIKIEKSGFYKIYFRSFGYNNDINKGIRLILKSKYIKTTTKSYLISQLNYNNENNNNKWGTINTTDISSYIDHTNYLYYNFNENEYSNFFDNVHPLNKISDTQKFDVFLNYTKTKLELDKYESEKNIAYNNKNNFIQYTNILKGDIINDNRFTYNDKITTVDSVISDLTNFKTALVNIYKNNPNILGNVTISLNNNLNNVSIFDNESGIFLKNIDASNLRTIERFDRNKLIEYQNSTTNPGKIADTANRSLYFIIK
jgi:hypothetical protein